MEHTWDIAPDGATLVTSWRRFVVGHYGDDLVLVDRADGTRRPLAEGEGFHADPAFSPDGRHVVTVYGTDGTKDEASRTELVLFDVESGERRRIATSLDQWPSAPTWSRDGSAIFFIAHEHGNGAIFRVEIADDRVTRLTGEGTYSDLCPSPGGDVVYALRAHPDRPPHVVRLDARAERQDGTELPSPARAESELPQRGVLERVVTRADDGVEIGAWLLRPASASPEAPAPLLTLVHGGPLGTWAGWSWRWNGNLFVERGYAVLLPDPAISLGYGQAFIDRGWGRWGERPYTDVIASIEGALQRSDLDSSRTALLGGSFGGYMANWVAGQTDRFRGDCHARLAVGPAHLSRGR